MVWRPRRGGKVSERRPVYGAGSVSRDFQTSAALWFSPIFQLTVEKVKEGSPSRKKLRISVPAIIEEEGDVFGAWIPSLPGCVAMGDTFEEARENLEAALRDVLDLHKKEGTFPNFRDPRKDEIQVEMTDLIWISVPW